MYEELIAFLLGKKDEFTDEDLNEFMSLLVKALDLSPEYEILEKQTLVENMMDTAQINSEEERFIIGTKLNKILRIEHIDDITTRKRPTRIAKFTNSTEKLFNSRRPLNERLGESSTQNNTVLSSHVPTTKIHNNNVLNSDHIQNETTPNIKFDDSDKLINVFLNNFSKTKFNDSVDNVLNTTNNISDNENNTIIGSAKKEREFHFDIESLEDNQNSGPEFFFDLDDK